MLVNFHRYIVILLAPENIGQVDAEVFQTHQQQGDGRLLTAEHRGVPMDFDQMIGVGSMLGSAAVIVIFAALVMIIGIASIVFAHPRVTGSAHPTNVEPLDPMTITTASSRS